MFTERLLPTRFELLAIFLVFASTITRAQTGGHWTCSWAASQQLVEPENSLSAQDLHDATLRQSVHLSLGGSEVRLRLSNRFGDTPLQVTGAHIARPLAAGSDKIEPGTDKELTFSGSPEVTIPPHADYISDPVSFPVNALSDLAITLHIDEAPAGETGHPGSRTTTYVAHGDLVSAGDLPGAKKVDHWYYVAGIDVVAGADAAAIVALGDSITDGHGATTNGNDRWTDVLAQRLQSSPGTRNIAVLNHGIGGNHLLTDGLGPNALARLDHDVLAQPGVRYLIVLEGINDVGFVSRMGDVPRAEHNALVRRMIAAYQQIIVRAHTLDIKVIGATIMPFTGSSYYHPGPANEADRQAVNEWIRTSGGFDALIDFDEITRDPQHPDRLSPNVDSGDHLHPSAAGYAIMANAIPLSVFAAPQAPARRIAVTFDDLPAHGPLPAGETRMEVISKIIAALRGAGAPPTYGFVNGVRIQEQPGDIAVLQAWRSSGNLLGNHSWSHPNLNQLSLADFERDVLRDEPVLQPLMKNEDWRWFRYPFLAEGDTPEKRTAFRNFLQEHGYKVAAVTMSFGDYLWNEPYARCKAKGDEAAILRLQGLYLSAADESIGYYSDLSQTLYQREIPYVLLMHIGALDAEVLPRLLQLYRDRGFQFVTLEQAEQDDYYRGAVHPDLPTGAEMLEGVMASRGLSLPPRRDFAAELNSMCR